MPSSNSHFRGAAAPFAALLLALSVGSGCATTATNPDESAPSAPKSFADVPVEPLAFDEATGFAFVDGRTGASLSFDEVMARANAANAVLVGEQHNLASHHLLQTRVMRRLADGRPLAIAIEFVANNHNEALASFVAGEIDAAGLTEATGWEKEWGHDFDLYRPIFEAALELSTPIYGVNAPRSLVRAVAKNGVNGVSEEERALIPELDLNDEAHKAGIREVFEEHHPAIDRHKAFESFYTVQVLWDESMADGSARALAKHGRVLVLAGNGHIAGYRAIPNRLLRRAPEATLLTIIPVTLDTDDDAMEVAKEGVGGREGDIIAIERAREVLSL